MLKTIQFLGSSSSSGFVSYRLKQSHHVNQINALSFISPSPKTSPSSSSSSSSSPSRTCKGFTSRKFRMSLAHSDGTSPSSSSPTSHFSSSPASFRSTGNTRKINFCQSCGGPTKQEIPDGEEKMRCICTLCGKIAYENPKMVVGCLIEHDNKILLCKRNIQPSYGLWTLPAGYMEMGESATEGAIRETWEEAGAEVEVLSPFAQLDIPLIGQFSSSLEADLYNFPSKVEETPLFTPESSEVRLFAFEDIPFDSLAFSSMLVTLDLYIQDTKAGKPKFHYGIINKRPGTSPSEIREYTLDHHMQT